MNIHIISLILVFSAAFLVGCADNSLYMASYSRAAIDASSDGAGIGVKSAYIHVTPTKSDGSAYTVVGKSDVDLSFSETIISEILATGAAAVCASMPRQESTPVQAMDFLGAEKFSFLDKVANPDAQARPTLIFGSFNSVSLVDLSWADATSQGLTFGYKRSTGVKIPIQDGAVEVASTFAKVTINTTDNTGENMTRVDGIRTTHTFATGKAALIKASMNAKALSGLRDDDPADLGCVVP